MYGIDEPLDDFRQWLSRSWYESVASGDEKHLRAGTNAIQTEPGKGTMIYMAKEVGKTKQAVAAGYPDGIGRWWGVKHKDNLPWSPQKYRTITDPTANKIIRLMTKIAELRSREYHSLSIFADGQFWSERLDDIIELFEDGAEVELPKRPLARLVAAENRLL